MTLLNAVPEFKPGSRCLTFCSLIALCLSSVVQADTPPAATCSDDAPTRAIQDRRSAFNAAIADKDAATIATVLTDDVLLITGTDSDLYSGREVQLELWQSDFESSERLIYVRMPDCIRISERFPIALEHGRWRGEPENDDPGIVQGSYSAKWRHDGTGWRVEAEFYMTEECSQSICPEDEAAR